MTVGVRRDQAIMVREIDGQLVVLDTEANKLHQLNVTAGFIWRLCETGASIDTIAARLAESFDVAEPTARQDVLQTLATLRDLNLIEPS
jgi:hypothetical protein